MGIKVGAWFEFEPEGEHEDLFEGYNTDAEKIQRAKEMAYEDLTRFAMDYDLWRMLSVEITEND